MRSALFLWLASLLLCAVVFGEEGAADAAAEASQADAAASDTAADGEETDETKLLLKQLTIGMASEVIDERTIAIRDAAGKGGKRTIHLRLGNTDIPPKGSLSDEDYAEKVRVAKENLQKLVDKQMIWYKVAPETFQQPAPSAGSEPDIVVADLWSIDGKHISTALKKDGHLGETQEYETELGKDILTVASEEEKKDSYKKLEEALKESEKAKKEAAKAAKKKVEEEEAAESEPIGMAGWLGLVMLGVIVVGAATNFGRKSNKKVNLNRKKGPLERFWNKLKGE